MFGRFEFDRAKSFIDSKRDVFIKLAPTFPYQNQLMHMLLTFSHLAEAEKAYYHQPFITSQLNSNHSFLPTSNTLKKTKILKQMYSDIEAELQQYEDNSDKQRQQQQQNKKATLDQSTTAPQPPLTPPTILTSSLGSQSNRKSLTPSNTNSKVRNKESVPTETNPTERRKLVLVKQASDCEEKVDLNVDSPTNTCKLARNGSLSNSSSATTPSTGEHISSASSQASPASLVGIRNTFMRVLSQSNSASPAPHNGYDAPPNSSTTTPTNLQSRTSDFNEQLISHFCNQLLLFTQARYEMIGVYESLGEALSEKYALSIEKPFNRLAVLCRSYQKCFHHPLLSPIKDSMSLECETLMALMNGTIGLQHWRYLDSLFALQEAQSKLNFWRASSFQKDQVKRRFKVSKTSSNAPRLYEWFCRYREFLLAKFTILFHSTLTKYSCGFVNFKSVCSKLSVDFYAKLVSFSKKLDSSLIFTTLLFDISNEQDFHGLGYNYNNQKQTSSSSCLSNRNPSVPFAVGKNTLQPILVIPSDNRAKLNSLQAEIYMLVSGNEKLINRDGYCQFYDVSKKLTYCITRLDYNVVLVIVVESQRTDRDLQIRNFIADFSNQFSYATALS